MGDERKRIAVKVLNQMPPRKKITRIGNKTVYLDFEGDIQAGNFIEQLRQMKLIGGRLPTRLPATGIMLWKANTRQVIAAPAAAPLAAFPDYTWAATSAMAGTHLAGGAWKLTDGRVVVFGGSGSVLTEIYSADGATRSAGGAIPAHGIFVSSCLLGDGRILAAGGGTPGATENALASTFDPNTNTWSAETALSSARTQCATVTLASGRGLVTGGAWTGGFRTNVDEFNHATDTWTAKGPLGTGRAYHSAVLLADGRVLIIGGQIAGFDATATCEIYDPTTGLCSATGSMAVARREIAAAVLLPSGNVMVAGGRGLAAAPLLSSVEIYDTTLGTWSTVTAMSTARRAATSCVGVLLTGTYTDPGPFVVIAGGASNAGATAVVEVYDVTDNTWTTLTPLSTARQYNFVVELDNFNLLVGGYDATAEIGTVVP